MRLFFLISKFERKKNSFKLHAAWCRTEKVFREREGEVYRVYLLYIELACTPSDCYM